ncbi:MAG: hypothetical protein ACI9R3_002027 [Verrucomicrobiales bacterium]|jgi:hypothetical protein
MTHFFLVIEKFFFQDGAMKNWVASRHFTRLRLPLLLLMVSAFSTGGCGLGKKPDVKGVVHLTEPSPNK